MPQLKKSDELKLGLSVGLTCLGEYLLLQTNISLSQEMATVGSKKRKHFLTKILMELDLEDFGETSTAPPRSNVNPSQCHEIVLPQGPNHYNQLHKSTQHHEIFLPQRPNHQHENTSGATPSSVWLSDLITILQQIAALPCHQPLKPLFTFKFSLEVANKNFILLTCKFGGDLSKALLAQSDSPLGYGSEFKPIEMIELIFRNHPSWSQMKQVLTHGSKWPLQPLDKVDRIKDVEEALIFGNHKGTVKQQDLLVKLVTDDVI